MTGAERQRRHRLRKVTGEAPLRPSDPEVNLRRKATIRARFQEPRPCDSCQRVSRVRTFGLTRWHQDGTRSGRQRSAGSLDLCATCWQDTKPACQLCQERKPSVVMFPMVDRRTVNGVRTSKSAGAVPLCKSCYDRTAKPRMGVVGWARLTKVAA